MGILCQRERSMEQATNTEKLSLEQNLQGKTALITGASSGLGARFARVLAAAGARIIITARRADRLADLAEQITEADGQVLNETLDVSQLEALPDFYDSLNARGWIPDILVNNAGMNISKPALDTTPEEFNQVLTTNLDAPFFLATEFARPLIEKGQAGRIINIASVGGLKVLPGATPYCVSKSGLVMMTRGLAREWARYDINVNALCPGYIETEINDFWWKTEGGQKQINSFPRRRLAEQNDLDGAILLLAGPLGKGITGTTLTVDDGQYI